MGGCAPAVGYAVWEAGGAMAVACKKRMLMLSTHFFHCGKGTAHRANQKKKTLTKVKCMYKKISLCGLCLLLKVTNSVPLCLCVQRFHR